MIDPRSAQPGSYRTSGHGAETGRQTQVAALSGRAGVWSGQPGAASPAGWSPPPAGEAAPPVRHRGPARSDGAPGVPEARWLSLTRLGPRHIPVVGPTEALHGRPGGPGMVAPRGAVPRPPAHQHKSGWQLAHQVWQDAGVEWEAAPAPHQPDPYAPDRYAPDPYAPRLPGPDEPDLDEPDLDEPEFAAGAALAGPDATRPDLPVLREPDDSRFGLGPWPVQQPAMVPRPQPVRAGQSAEHHTPTGHDAPAKDDEPAEHVEPAEHRGQSESWPPAPRPSAPAPRRPAPAPRFATRQRPSVSTPPSAFAAPGAFGPPPAYASPRLSVPLGAPVEAPPLASAPLLDSAPPLRSAPPFGQPDELFRAWQGSVRAATARPATRPAVAGARRRRRRAWQAARIGVPAAVLVTVGAGALMMLTGRANEMLAQRASTGPLLSAAPGASASLGITALGAGTTLTGYQGEHGAVAVAALWSAGGTLMAVGYANGHPAVWRHAAGGAWSLVPAAMFGGLTGHLTSVAHGPAGWVAVGSAIKDGTAQPVAFSSPDGVSWSPLPALTALARTDAQFLGVASGPAGYVVVGRQGTGAAAYASFWSSANLTDWVTNAGSGHAGTVAAAAVPVGDGFVAVGAAAHCHTIWTSPDGRQWTQHDLAVPSGATTATLRSVAAGAGGAFVAAGFAAAGTGNVPLVVTSARAGAPLTQVVLGANGAAATVTGVTATSGGFVAVGLAGPAGARHAVEWTSRDGLTWSAAAPLAAAGTSEITALTTSGALAAGTAQRSAGPTVLTIPGR